VIKPLLVEPEASQELADAALWYDDQRPGLGQRFLEAVAGTLDRIIAFPAAGMPVPHVPSEVPARRAPVKRFPYHVVFLDTQVAIRVLAIAHDHRTPGYWQNRPQT
jgi:toxin ParE2